VSLSRAQLISTFVECARTVILSLSLRPLRLASWIRRGDLAEHREVHSRSQLFIVILGLTAQQ
jgi:hypothetical protein